MIPGALGFAAPAALPLPAGAAAGSCSCPPGFPSPPGPSPPGSEPADPGPPFPALGAPPHANDAPPAPLPSRAERRRGGSGTPGSGGRKHGPGAPGPHSGPGPSPAAPGTGEGEERVVSKATQTYERLTEPAAAPGTGRSFLPGRLNPGTRTDFLPCLSPPCDGVLPAPASGRGRAGQRPPEPPGSLKDGTFLVRPAQGREPVRSPSAVGQCLFCLAAEDPSSSVCAASDFHSPFLSFHDLE